MALSKLAVRRLTKLADFMAALPKSASKNFDMGTWFAHYGNDGREHGYKPGAKLKLGQLQKCGSVACALGWATAVPAFHRAGLTIKLDESGTEGGVIYKRSRYSSMDAARLFFDLEYDEAEYLFGCVSATTQKQWATACRKFVKSGGLY